MFRVGQKVVCVDAVPRGIFFPGEELVKGEIYTVRAIGPSFGELAIQLEELRRITNHPFSRPGIWGYAARRFRPIVERETDISIFKAMLIPAQKKERV